MHKTIIAAVLTSVLIPGYAVALEDIHTGTVIVGSGVSGLTTAILLKEHKQNVLVLEKMPFMGGTTNLAAQYFVSVGTKDQVANGKELSVPDYIQRTAKTGRNSEMLPRTAQRMFDSQNSSGQRLSNGHFRRKFSRRAVNEGIKRKGQRTFYPSEDEQ